MQPSPGFIEKGGRGGGGPVSGSSLGENALLTGEARDKQPEWFELTETWQQLK